MKPFEVIEYRDHKINLFYDEDSQDPNDWGTEDRMLIYDHRQFCVKVKGFDPDDIYRSIIESKNTFYEGYYVFPLYAYIHSGVALSLSKQRWPFDCPWDTSFKGFVLVKRQKGTWGFTQAYNAAKSLTEIWNDILSGSVYGYDSIAGSCWGFIGDDGMKEMIRQAKEEIDYYILKKKHEHFEMLKKWIKGKKPITYRAPAPEICFI